MDDLKSKFFQISRTVTQYTGEFLKTTKLSVSLSSEEENLKKIYIDIGKKVHEIYMFGGSLGKFFDEKYLEIEACEKKIAEIKSQINITKGTKTCPKCGKDIEANAEFCSKCGFKAGDVSVVPPKPEEIPENIFNIIPDNIPETPVTAVADTHEALTPAANKVCPVCKSENPGDQKFCLSCGRLL